jgi:hypothetical protein
MQSTSKISEIQQIERATQSVQSSSPGRRVLDPKGKRIDDKMRYMGRVISE